MIKLENTQVLGWEAAIRGMRMPKESFDRSDSVFAGFDDYHTLHGDCGSEFYPKDIHIGPNDHDLMMSLAKGGSVHAKYRRMIQVYVDITAPIGFWHDFDTYHIGVAKNSSSRRNAVLTRQFSLNDFTFENLSDEEISMLSDIVGHINEIREQYLETHDIKFYRRILDMLPSCYNQKATWMGNYEVLVGVYRDRKNHFYSEFHDLCRWIEELPYSELITGGTSK